MRQGPDRKMLRRRKRSAYAKLAVGGLLFFPFVLVVPLCLMCALAEWVVGGNDGDPVAHTIAMTAMFVGIAAIGVALARWSLRTVEQGYRDVVSATSTGDIDRLPADEILVRGSEEPALAQSDVLLRAVQRGQETPQEELLRVRPE